MSSVTDIEGFVRIFCWTFYLIFKSFSTHQLLHISSFSCLFALHLSPAVFLDLLLLAWTCPETCFTLLEACLMASLSQIPRVASAIFLTHAIATWNFLTAFCLSILAHSSSTSKELFNCSWQWRKYLPKCNEELCWPEIHFVTVSASIQNFLQNIHCHQMQNNALMLYSRLCDVM